MMKSFVVSLLPFFALSQESYPRVPVEVFYEAQCPSCQAFITGTLSNTLALDDIFAITDLKMVF
jgi:hypothetical protein